MYLFKISLIFFLSRIFFINTKPIFFDSPEYINRLSDKNFLYSLTNGHLPLHDGYIIVFWPIYQLASFLGIEPTFFVILAQIGLSFLTLYFFLKITESIFNHKVAFLSLVIVSITPLFWITNVTIMMETVYLSSFFGSVYYLIKYLKSKKPNLITLFISSLLYGFSLITHLVVILWLPLVLYMAVYINKNRVKHVTLYFFLSIVTSSIINSLIIVNYNLYQVFQGIIVLYGGKFDDHATLSLDIESILRFIRNAFIPLLRINTSLLVIVSFVALIKLFNTNKNLLILFILWLVPSLIANQWWDSLFYGRHSLITSFGIATLVSWMSYKNKKISVIIIIYLTITVAPALYLLRIESPYFTLAKTEKTLPKNSFLIESHFARPQVDMYYKGEVKYVGEPSFEFGLINKQINEALKSKRMIFVSSQALSEPYGLYSGPYLHPLSLSYKNEFILKDAMEKFSLKEYKVINKKDNLIIYQLVSSRPSKYPQILKLKSSRRRIDFSDPFLRLWIMLTRPQFS